MRLLIVHRICFVALAECRIAVREICVEAIKLRRVDPPTTAVATATDYALARQVMKLGSMQPPTHRRQGVPLAAGEVSAATAHNHRKEILADPAIA